MLCPPVCSFFTNLSGLDGVVQNFHLFPSIRDSTVTSFRHKDQVLIMDGGICYLDRVILWGTCHKWIGDGRRFVGDSCSCDFRLFGISKIFRQGLINTVMVSAGLRALSSASSRIGSDSSWIRYCLLHHVDNDKHIICCEHIFDPSPMIHANVINGRSLSQCGIGHRSHSDFHDLLTVTEAELS